MVYHKVIMEALTASEIDVFKFERSTIYFLKYCLSGDNLHCKENYETLVTPEFIHLVLKSF